MCGLIGFTGMFVTKNDMTIWKTLFMMNTLRGAHGCGTVMTFDKKNKAYYKWDHSELPSSAYIFTPEFHKFMNEDRIKSLMGHSRHATVGKIEVANNHPFKTNSLLGMHNGTITGKFKDSDKYETDSEAFYNLLDSNSKAPDKGIKETLESVYKDSTSMAYALQWYDRRDDCIRLIRNHSRTLFIARHKQTSKLWWASERGFLTAALDRANDLKDYEIEPVPPHALITIDPNAYGDQRIIVQPNYYSPPVTTYYTYGQQQASFRSQHWNYNDTEHWKNGRRQPHTKDKGKQNNQSPKEEDFYKVGNRIVSESDLLKELNKPCAVCGNISCNLDSKGLPALHFTKEYICTDCVESENLESYGFSKDNLEDIVKQEGVNA